MQRLGMLTRMLILLTLLPVFLHAQEPVRLELHGYRTAADATAPLLPFDASRHLNLGFSSTPVWVPFSVINPTEKVQKRLLVLDNPLLESVRLYDENGSIRTAGMLHIAPHQEHLLPAFALTIGAHQTYRGMLQIQNSTTTLQFGITLYSPEAFTASDNAYKSLLLLFLGMLVSLALLSLMMYVYANDSSYLLYVWYLAALVYQQLTYTGLLPLYAPAWFTRIDNAIVVPKVSLMIIAAAFYARAFLKTALHPDIDRIYKAFIVITLVHIPFVATRWLYLPELTIFIGLFFILFNTAAAILIYRRGHKEARFFIAAWLLLGIGYFVMIADALGWVSLMHHFPELIMATTVVEALLLMLAFVDRFRIYQQQKLQLEQQYNKLLGEQKAQVEAQVIERTDELDRALKTERTLFKELNHRVKNNLQLILSVLRLQTGRAEHAETKEQLSQLQGRIETIAGIHEMLYQKEGAETIDMQAYLQRVNQSLLQSLAPSACSFTCHCHAQLPLREAVYVGLIINELFTNALKHAPNKLKDFSITMTQTDLHYELEIITPCQHEVSAKEGLGMTIVKTLIYEQLEGTMEQRQNDCTHTRIRFTL